MRTRTLNFPDLVFLSGLVVISVCVTPWNNLEPVVLPKLAALTSVVWLSAVIAVIVFKRIEKNIFDLFSQLLILSTVLSITNLIFNNQFFSERLIGITGRNFGAVSYICLMLLVFLSRLYSARIHVELFLVAIKISSFIVSGYFIVQILGFDKAQWIDSYGGVPSSTLGNPNFVSAFVAISLVATLPLVFKKETKVPVRLIVILISALELFVIYRSNSFQGFAIFALSLLYLGANWVFQSVARKSSRRALKILVYSTPVIGLLFTLVLWRSFSYFDNSSIKARIDYWHAGLKMGLDSPLIGQGFDFFGENYLRFRSESAALRAPGLFTDSAHNYFLDVFAAGGFPLLLSFTGLLTFVFLKNLKIRINAFKKDKSIEFNDAPITGLYIAWLGFLFQMILSPFNIAIAYLGFLLTGFLFGKYRSIETLNSFAQKSKSVFHLNSEEAKKNQNGILRRMPLVALLSILPVLGSQPLVADAKFRDGIERGDGEVIYQITMNQPKSYQRMEYSARIFIANARPDLALPIVKSMVRENPENIRGWRILLELSNNEANQKKIRRRILSLDPNNPDLRSNYGTQD